jgi:hypothetical protein
VPLVITIQRTDKRASIENGVNHDRSRQGSS